MPSHATHAIFARKAVASAAGPVDPSPWLDLGAQGPDPFFHGVRRQPSGELWGHRIHGEGYGRLAAAMADRIRRSDEHRSEHLDYLRGFVGHAVLDRAVHPWVNYFSGWEGAAVPTSGSLKFCHPFLERLIDMVMLRDILGSGIREFAFSTRIPDVAEQNRVLPGLLASAIRTAYPDAGADDELETRIRNALKDDMDFLRLLDISGPGERQWARDAESRGELPERALALFYPDEIPPVDVMNEDGAGWVDPRRGGEKRRDSFMDLFWTALKPAAALTAMVDDIVLGSGSPGDLEGALGNGDLTDGSRGTDGTKLLYCDPLPLSSIIDGMYAAVSG